MCLVSRRYFLGNEHLSGRGRGVRGGSTTYNAQKCECCVAML